MTRRQERLRPHLRSATPQAPRLITPPHQAPSLPRAQRKRPRHPGLPPTPRPSSPPHYLPPMPAPRQRPASLYTE
ncbi:hypothetical protein BDZ91DRAFT_743875 [Kalaharituber pfeilii]|nr:hypothetical protein BDZ91DRAFT_743875 [Kalaharituber pfeilii]